MPMDVQTIQPAWSTCTGYEAGIWDPPRALIPQEVLTPTTTVVPTIQKPSLDPGQTGQALISSTVMPIMPLTPSGTGFENLQGTDPFVSVTTSGLNHEPADLTSSHLTDPKDQGQDPVGPLSLITIGSQTVARLGPAFAAVGSKILSANGPTVTVDNTPLYMISNDLVLASQTIPLSKIATIATVVTNSIIPTDVSNSSPGSTPVGMSLSPGGPRSTMSRTPISDSPNAEHTIGSSLKVQSKNPVLTLIAIDSETLNISPADNDISSLVGILGNPRITTESDIFSLESLKHPGVSEANTLGLPITGSMGRGEIGSAIMFGIGMTGGGLFSETVNRGVTLTATGPGSLALSSPYIVVSGLILTPGDQAVAASSDLVLLGDSKSMIGSEAKSSTVSGTANPSGGLGRPITPGLVAVGGRPVSETAGASASMLAQGSRNASSGPAQEFTGAANRRRSTGTWVFALMLARPIARWLSSDILELLWLLG